MRSQEDRCAVQSRGSIFYSRIAWLGSQAQLRFLIMPSSLLFFFLMRTNLLFLRL
jgi:hypothetical protein